MLPESPYTSTRVSELFPLETYLTSDCIICGCRSCSWDLNLYSAEKEIETGGKGDS